MAFERHQGDMSVQRRLSLEKQAHKQNKTKQENKGNTNNNTKS